MHSNGYANGQAAHNKTEILDRQPPSDPPSEAALLGSVLLTPGIMADVAAKLSTADLYDHEHQPVYRAMLAVHGRGLPVDATLVAGAMADAGAEHAPGILAGLLRGATAANWRGYLNRVLDCAARRRYIQTFTEGLQKVYGGGTVQSIQRHIEESLADTWSDAEKITYQRITSAELDSNDWEEEYLVEGVLVAGQNMVTSAPQKGLKTTIMVDLHVSLDCGSDFLGKFRVNRCVKSAFFTGESGMSTIKKTARASAAEKGRSLGELGVIWTPDLPKFGDPAYESALADFLKADEIEFASIDPAYLAMMAGDPGNLFAQGALLRSMVDICKAVGTQINIVTHSRKEAGRTFEPPSLEQISWSGFREFARQWVLLSRRQPYEPGTGDHKLWISFGGSAGHSSLWGLDVFEGVHPQRFFRPTLLRPDEVRQAVNDTVDAAKDEKKRIEIDRDKAAILRAVVSIPEKVGTQSEIRTRSGRNGQKFAIAFAELVGNELVEVELVKGNNRRYTAYKLKESEPQ